jgi:hypothetical protein
MHLGGDRNAHKILVDILEARAERTWEIQVHNFIINLFSDAVGSSYCMT